MMTRDRDCNDETSRSDSHVRPPGGEKVRALRYHQAAVAKILEHFFGPFSESRPGKKWESRAHLMLVGLVYALLSDPKAGTRLRDLPGLAKILGDQFRADGARRGKPTKSTRPRKKGPIKPFSEIVREVYGTNWHGKE